jgi:anti-sigma B factor antagonist
MTTAETHPNFCMNVVAEAEGVCVKLKGELDIAGAPELRDALAQLSEEPGCSILIDVADLTYLDSTGISVLVVAAKRIRSEGGSFAVANVSGAVRRILEITGLVEFLEKPDPPR